ncbi:uncharacterized protein O9250_012387 [Rhynochetos jubatus]
MPLPTAGEKEHPDLNLFADGSSYYEGGQRCTRHTVTQVLLAGPFSPDLGAQGEEMVAAEYATGHRVDTCTDSKYTFGACRAAGVLWEERGFLTSPGKTIAHGELMKGLREAIPLPSELAVIDIKAPTNKQDKRCKGNALADQAAKAAARQVFAVTWISGKEPDTELPDKGELSEELPGEEKQLWEKLGAQHRGGQWILGSKPLLLKRYLLPITREKTHGGPGNVALRIQSRRGRQRG